jgi:uncharacterized protein (DUF1697 family)
MSAQGQQRHVAFLRAINVGGHVVTMARLRELLGTLALGDVETFIASGNVVFTTGARDSGVRATAALERRIARCLHEALGYEVATFVRSAAEVAALATLAPFAGVGEGDALHVGFLHAPPDAAARDRLLAFGDERNTFAVPGREVWWWSRGRISDSGIDGGRLERALGAPMTMRNVNTLRRLAAKYGA